ncbi:MAG: GTP 3',8-cyclase MoaA [Vicinamibacteria bacterium]
MLRVEDRLGRPLRSLRVSVTDRCNLRCHYCMPEKDYVWLPRADLLSFEETARVVGVFAGLGVDKVRLTGGEPLLRRSLPDLVRLLSAESRLREVALTTNGLLLLEQAKPLRAAGLARVTVSLDTLKPERFREISRRDGLEDVLSGIEAARSVGLSELKLDSVIVRDMNDDEVPDLIGFAKSVSAEVRFIEYMDVGGATRWSPERVFGKSEILNLVEERFGGPIAPIDLESWAPAKRYRLPDGTVFGIIASTTEPFCRTCDRSRLTADGLFYSCLYAQKGLDLRARLRGGASDEDIRDLLESAWRGREDRGAEIRRELAERDALLQVERLRKDPHLEMHTRGG